MHSTWIETESIRCANCGYALAGNESGRCPECGLRYHLSNPAEIWYPLILVDNPMLRGNLYIKIIGFALFSALGGGVGLLAVASTHFPLALCIPGFAFGSVILLPLALHVTPKWLRHIPSLATLPVITTAAFFAVAYSVELGRDPLFLFPAAGAVCAGACVVALILAMRLRRFPHWYSVIIVGMLLGALFNVSLMAPTSAMTPVLALLIFVIWHHGVALTCTWALTTSPLQFRTSVLQRLDGSRR